jgi:hypothetical protein
MKRILKTVFALTFVSGLLLTAAAILLLLNITAPNPTGRRYSSQMPLMTGGGMNIGLDAERILAHDLRLPNNNDPAQRQCLCHPGSSIPSDCNLCIPVAPLQSAWRIPDFVSDRFLAESKNRANLPYDGREVDQIVDYAAAAISLGRPLWVYVRVNTPVAPEFDALVESTGGAVIPYFTVPGYHDTVDAVAQRLLWAGLLLTACPILTIGFFAARATPARPTPAQRTIRTLQHAEDFSRKTRTRLQSQLKEKS